MIKAYIQQKYQAWLKRRLPATQNITLNQRRLFIFPSVQGVYFLIVCLLILIAGINYQNNLIYGVTFFLLSLFNTAIGFTYLNLSGLTLRSAKSPAVFAGDSAEFQILLSGNNGKVHERIALQLAGGFYQQCDVLDGDELSVNVHCETQQRGVFIAPRLLIESYYPLGIMRCWSWLDLNLRTIVYPKPMKMAVLPSESLSEGKGKHQKLVGSDDFAGFKHYEAGDAMRHVNWRGFAKGQDLQTKTYATQQDHQHWVDWQQLLACGLEERLSKMCYWALQLDKKNQPYGLRLPNQTIQPDTGEQHRHKVLSALALFSASGSHDGAAND